MEVIYVLIPLSLILVGAIAWAFLWAVNRGQFDDLERRGSDILLDDEDRPPSDAQDPPPR